MPNEKSGQNIRLSIRGGGDERELEVTVGSVELVSYRIVDSKSPTPEQLKIRESWHKTLAAVVNDLVECVANA